MLLLLGATGYIGQAFQTELTRRGERGEPGSVEHLVRQQQVVAQPGGHHAQHLSGGGARERVVTVGVLRRGQGGALVGLHMRPQSVARPDLRHGGEVVLEGARVDDERGGWQVVDEHVPAERLELSLAAS